MVRVKSNLDGDIRRFALEDSPTIDALREQIRSVYNINDFIIKYTDEDGDLVTITSDGELTEAVSDMDKKALLRVDIFKTNSTRPAEVSTLLESPEVVTDQCSVVKSNETASEAAAPSEPIAVATAEQPTTTEDNNEEASGTSANGARASASRDSDVSTDAEPMLEELLNNMVCIAAQVMGGGYREDNCTSNEASREEEELITSPIPRPTLGFGSTGSEVRKLQKVLTDLGHMTPADYRIRAGLYGPRTASGVVRFRMECGLGYGVYDDPAAAALRSLVESGVPATMASGAGGSENTESNSQTDEKTEA